MISYEIHVRGSEGKWVKIPDGLAHRKLAKAKEELQEKKRQYPEAFVAAVDYTTRGDVSHGARAIYPSSFFLAPARNAKL